MRAGSSLVVVTALAFGCSLDRPLPRASPPLQATGETPRPAGVREIFEFRIGVWTNLHQVLVHEALLPRPGFEGPKSLARRSVAPIAELAPPELGPWRDALAYYDRRFTTRNTFDDDLVAAARTLSASADARSLPPTAMLAPEWKRVLDAALPVYRARFWSAHERADRAYVEQIRPVVAAHGAWFVERLVAVYETPWPDAPVPVEVAPAVPPFGASTVGEPPFDGPRAPLITISSIDPGYSGETGLEMLFHEGSHLLSDRVQAKIEASAKRQGRSIHPSLWHFVVFYTAGHVAKERLGPGYVPYAERPEHTVFSGANAPILTVLAREWQPYLDGKRTLEQAVDAVVAGS